MWPILNLIECQAVNVQHFQFVWDENCFDTGSYLNYKRRSVSHVSTPKHSLHNLMPSRLQHIV